DDPSRQSIGDMVRGVTDDAIKLLRQELQLAKLEFKDEATRAAKAGGMLGGAGVAGHMVLVFVSLATMFGLGELMDLGWAALIVGVVWGIVGLVLYSVGRKQMSEVTLKPDQTIQTLKEDVQWAQNRTN
ncbi:MAG: phage holin family protein, partial [Candidatus Nanopelagicales bacterium]